MRKFSLAAVAVIIVFTSCISGFPQYRKMPEGPLQEFFYQSHLYRMPDQPYIYVHLWRENSNGKGGLLVYEKNEPTYTSDDLVQPNEWKEPQPIRVGEEVFTKVYDLIKEKRLFRMEKTYSTFIKDAYAYSPWEMTIAFPGKTVRTTSDGTYAKHFDHDDFRAPMNYLKDVWGE